MPRVTVQTANGTLLNCAYIAIWSINNKNIENMYVIRKLILPLNL